MLAWISFRYSRENMQTLHRCYKSCPSRIRTQDLPAVRQQCQPLTIKSVRHVGVCHANVDISVFGRDVNFPHFTPKTELDLDAIIQQWAGNGGCVRY